MCDHKSLCTRNHGLNRALLPIGLICLGLSLGACEGISKARTGPNNDTAFSKNSEASAASLKALTNRIEIKENSLWILALANGMGTNTNCINLLSEFDTKATKRKNTFQNQAGPQAWRTFRTMSNSGFIESHLQFYVEAHGDTHITKFLRAQDKALDKAIKTCD